MGSQISARFRAVTAALGKPWASEIMIVVGAIPGLAVPTVPARLAGGKPNHRSKPGIAAPYALCIWGVLLDMARRCLIGRSAKSN